MKAGHVAAFVLIAAYLGIEAVAVARARDRMEPEAMYAHLLAAEIAVERCEADVPPQQVADFEVVAERFRTRVTDELLEATPALDSAAAEAALEALVRRTEAEVLATLDAEGCDSFTGRRYVQRHLMYSRR